MGTVRTLRTFGPPPTNSTSARRKVRTSRFVSFVCRSVDESTESSNRPAPCSCPIWTGRYSRRVRLLAPVRATECRDRLACYFGYPGRQGWALSASSIRPSATCRINANVSLRLKAPRCTGAPSSTFSSQMAPDREIERLHADSWVTAMSPCSASAVTSSSKRASNLSKCGSRSVAPVQCVIEKLIASSWRFRGTRAGWGRVHTASDIA